MKPAMVSRHGTYMSRNFFSIVAEVLLQASYKPELLSKKPRGSDRETCPHCVRIVITASFRLVFSSTGNMERQDIHAEI